MQNFRGFKCTFDRGCLSLWFNFRRDVSGLTPASVLVVDELAHSTTVNNHTLVKPMHCATNFIHWIILSITAIVGKRSRCGLCDEKPEFLLLSRMFRQPPGSVV